MRILVISDTHGDIEKAQNVIKKSRGIDLLIHLGDYFRDAQKLSNIFPDMPIEYVYGNSDFMIENVQAEKLLECEGKTIFITHGHRYSVKWDYEKLYRKAEETRADIILFGHTHVADIVKKDTLYLINPGSISDPRDNSNESYAIIDICEGNINPTLYYI